MNNNNTNINTNTAELHINIEQQKLDRLLQENIEPDKLALVKYKDQENLKDIESEMIYLDIEVEKILEYKIQNPNNSFEKDARELENSEEIIEEISNNNFSGFFDVVKQIREYMENLGKNVQESNTPLSNMIKYMSTGDLNEKVKSTIITVQTEVSTFVESLFPLGKFGDTTLNERIYYQKQMEALALRRKELLLVMAFVAPLAAISIVWCGKMSAGDLINVTIHSNEIKDVSSELISLGIMSRFFLNKKPNWFKYLLIILLTIFIIKTNIYLYLLPYLTFKYLKYFWMFALFYTIIYFSFNYIFLIILNKNNNFIIPSNFPGFVINQLKSLKNLSTDEYLYNREKKRNKLLAIVSLIVFISAILII